jgi:hypothetical protein
MSAVGLNEEKYAGCKGHYDPKPQPDGEKWIEE